MLACTCMQACAFVGVHVPQFTLLASKCYRYEYIYTSLKMDTEQWTIMAPACGRTTHYDDY